MKKFLSSSVYQQVLNAMSDGVFLAELPSQRVLFANTAACRLAGKFFQTEIEKNTTLADIFQDCEIVCKEENYSFQEFTSQEAIYKTSQPSSLHRTLPLRSPGFTFRYHVFYNDQVEDADQKIREHSKEGKKNAEPKWVMVTIRKLPKIDVMKKNSQLFIKTMGHELKQPLGLIKAYSYYLERHFKSNQSKASKYPKSINNQINIVVQMINDIIDTSKISLKSLKIHPQEIDVTPFVERIVTDMQAADHSHKFVFHSTGSIIGFVDTGRLSQVVNNLLLNAMKYSPENTTITTTLKKSRKWISLSITDEGIGIDDDELPYIFEPYFRSHLTRSKGHGLGLGLALVKEIITQHGGEILVESELNEGTTFHIRLPRKKSDVPVDSESRES